MTRNEARKLIKTNIPSKYSNTVVLLLLPAGGPDLPEGQRQRRAEITTTRASLLRSAAVESQTA